MSEKFIVKIDGHYYEWAYTLRPVIGEPLTAGLSREEMAAHLLNEYGRQGMPENRLTLVDQWGSTLPGGRGYLSADDISKLRGA